MGTELTRIRMRRAQASSLRRLSPTTPKSRAAALRPARGGSGASDAGSSRSTRGAGSIHLPATCVYSARGGAGRLRAELSSLSSPWRRDSRGRSRRDDFGGSGERPRSNDRRRDSEDGGRWSRETCFFGGRGLRLFRWGGLFFRRRGLWAGFECSGGTREFDDLDRARLRATAWSGQRARGSAGGVDGGVQRG